MRLRFYLMAVIAMAALAGCSDSKKVWIVVDLMMPNGKPGQMAFNNPSVPDMTLAECEQSLQSAVPTLMQGIESRPESRGSKYVSAKCVESADNPIKPAA